MEPTLKVLSGVPIFTGLSNDALRMIRDKGEVLDFVGGSLVVREGESDNRLYIILSGWVRVCKHLGTSQETELATLSEGEFFGEMCILDTLPRSASVQAVSDASLLSVKSLTFWELHQEQPSEYGVVILNIARDLSRRLRYLDENLAARTANAQR